MPSFIEKLKIQAGEANIRPQTKKSLDWFRKKVKGITNVNRGRLLKDSNLELRSRPTPGKMYMFRYTAKHKEVLPYYDKFPLIFMVEGAPKGFYGLNLHYLPPTIRAVFFDKLTDVANNARYDETTRVKISYDILKASTKFAQFKPCFKRYLTSYMRSQPTFVPASEWEAILFLPTEQFVGANKQIVWKDSRRMI